MRIVAIAILYIVYIVIGIPAYMHGQDNWLVALTYHFYHANLYHLAVNCLAVYSLFKVTPYRTDKDNFRDLAIGFVIATLTFYTATKPVVGISNILYAVIGLRTPDIRNAWWRNPSTITFLVVTLLMLLVPRFSAVTHITSFVAGALVASGTRGVKAYLHGEG